MRMHTVIVSMVISTALLSIGNVLVLLWQYQVTSSSRHLQISYGEQSRTGTSGVSGPRLVDEHIKNGSLLAPFASGLEICPHKRRPTNEEVVWIESNWQMTLTVNVLQDGKKKKKKPQGELIYLYSAYYDDRSSSGSTPSVRVLALSTLRRDAAVYCAVWLPDVDRPYTVKAVVNAEAGSGYSFRQRNHREYAYICPLPAFDPVPSAVSVTGVEPCPDTGYTTLVPVIHTPKTDRPPIEFGVCVTAGYGYIRPEVFVEWVELNRMFGASEINLYDTWFAPNMSRTFDYYRQLGVLNVHPLHHPRHSDKSGFFNKVRNLRIIALNDCQLRNMYRYRYMIVIDTDEIIVPRTTSNYSDLITELDRQRKVPGITAFTYVFLNIYFLLDFDADETRPSYLRTIQYRQRVRPKSYGYAPKSIVDPRQCSVLFNHYCARYLIRPPNKQKRTYRVPFATASSHHYRRCGHFYAYSCDRLFAEKTADDCMLKYERPIDTRVTAVLKQLGQSEDLT